ncbi:MAG: FAD-dependent oxidoreductase [Verrucomicrobiota bacterium]
MNRRRHLRHLSGLLISGGTLGCRSSLGARPARNRGESVIIVGAGVSGLGAAERLRESGFEMITILEGRERLGGRVWTSEVWKDAPMDLGASWIHGTRRNPITRLAREAGVETKPTDYDDLMIFNQAGKEFSREEMRKFNRLYRELYVALGSVSARTSGSVRDVVSAKLGSRTPEDQAMIDFALDAMIEQDFAEDVENLDAGAFDYGKAFGGGDVLFPGGYSTVFAPRFSPFEIHTGHVVKTVKWSAKEVTLLTNRGEFSADRVIITLPLGVLKRATVAFEPALPNGKLAALESLGMGCLNKLYLRFSEVFWPNDVQGFSYQSSPTGQWSQWLNMAYYTKAPILLGFTAGSFAREIEGWSDAKITNDVMEVLRGIFGKSIPAPIDMQRTRWAADPFTYGSYSALSPGANKATVEALGEPVGDRLFFAGEATSVSYPSTVHGAYMSGQREAERLISFG